LESEIQTLTEQLENKNTEHEKLEEFQTNLQKVFEDLSKKKEEIIYYDFAYSLLKDDGVKTKIIKKYLPFINQQVNRYLQMMDFYINFELDTEFNESIKSPIHEDFSYSSFSEGEKSRIDLSLLFAWREVARVKNSVNCNILLFDEVFDSSLDGFGADEFLKIIRYVIKDTNIFVISHKAGLEEKFESTFKFEKKGGFSYKTEL
jgi:DNA repair exonuclease SbcCD ATPase subunit